MKSHRTHAARVANDRIPISIAITASEMEVLHVAKTRLGTTRNGAIKRAIELLRNEMER